MRKAIVSSGNRKVICDVPDDTKPGDVVTGKKCYELYTGMSVVWTPQGLASPHSVTVMPVDAEDQPPDIDLKVDNIRFFDSMSDNGEKYNRMIAGFEDQMTQVRAKKAGIEPAQNMPGKLKSPIIIK